MPPTYAQGWQGINIEEQAQVEAQPANYVDIQGLWEPRTAPRTVAQVLASDNADPWEPVAKYPEETSPGDDKDSRTDTAQQDTGTDLEAEGDAQVPMDSCKATNRRTREDRWRPCETGPPPHIAGLWIPPWRTVCPPPGLVPTLADPWRIGTSGPPDTPTNRPLQE